MSDILAPNTAIALMQASENQSMQRANALKAEAKREMERIEEAAHDFEAVFMSEMMKPMFEGLDLSDSLMGGGKGEEVFQGLILQEYGKLMAEAHSIGIADHVKAHMIQMQSHRNTEQPTITTNETTTDTTHNILEDSHDTELSAN